MADELSGCPLAKRPKVMADYNPIENDINVPATGGGLNEDAKLGETLRNFHVLDEVNESEDEEDVEGTGDSNSELDCEEIESMLDEGLPDDLKNKKKEYEERYKTVLEEKGKNHFEVLPEGWVQVTHNSGMPLFLHRASRVCSVARPYFLGPGSVRKHEIPVSAIPCLSYRRAQEKEKELTEQMAAATANGIDVSEANATTSNGVSENSLSTTKEPASGAMPVLPNAKIETVAENLKAQSLTAVEMQDYCRRLFNFKTIRVMRFKSWSSRRKFTKNRKQIKNLQRPTLPDGTKLISLPILAAANNPRTRKEWIMNPMGKSFVCILHEYVQHALKKQPSYEFKELENAATPYSAVVSINDLKYGTGFGTSKKQAKSEAARETLEILIPEMRDKITNDVNKPKPAAAQQQDLSVFDEIKIEDPRVAEFCAKTTEPSPHAILITCLQRNFGLGEMEIKYEVNTMKHKKNEFTMTVGKHTATVLCKNKRDGKQRAAQAILQMLHPHIKTWGSLLRLYGNRSVKSFKEKKQEEQEITVLQSKAADNQPNYAILDKLRLEMTKLNERRSAIRPIGTFEVEVDEALPASSSNLNNVDL